MLDISTIKKLSDLSQIKLTNNECKKMLQELNETVCIIDKIKDFTKTEDGFSKDKIFYNDLRVDSPSDSYKTSKIIKNAQTTDANAFSIPKII